MAAEVGTVITDVAVMEASQMGMKAIGAAIAVGSTGLASAARDGHRFCSGRCYCRK